MSKIKKLKVQLNRDGSLESTHFVNVYKNDQNEYDYFFPRSAVKPFQLIPLLYEAQNQNILLTSEEIAIFSSSHSGQEIHTELIKTIAKKYDLDLERLVCGKQRPFHEPTADKLLQNNKEYTKLHHNCSGKHLAMLLFSKILNEDNKIYHTFKSKTQSIVKEFFQFIFTDNDIGFGTDGCGLPAIHLRTDSFLKAVNKIKTTEYSNNWSDMFNSYHTNPLLIGGENRTDTNIILNSSKTVLAKSGAEGVLFVTNNEESYLFKCIDGSKRGVDLAATKYLNEIGMVNEKPFEYLNNLYSLNTQNTKAVTIAVS